MGATLSPEMMAMEVVAQVVVTMVTAIAGTMVVGGYDHGGGPGDGAGGVAGRDASLLGAQASMVVVVINDCGGGRCWQVVVAVMSHALLVVHAARIMPIVGVVVDQVAVFIMLQIMVEV